MGMLIDTDELSLDSDVLTRWKLDVADAEREVGKPFEEQVLKNEDGTLTLLAANEEMQLACKVKADQWALPEDE